MYSFEFQHIDNLERSTLQHGFYLWVWYANKIPPHIGCSLNGNYFSLKYNGKDENIHFLKVLNVIDARKIPTLIIKVDKEISNEMLATAFSEYKNASPEGASCLLPINNALEKESCELLSELLIELTSANRIVSISGLHIPSGYKGIPFYGKFDVQERLKMLENAKIHKHISSIG